MAHQNSQQATHGFDRQALAVIYDKFHLPIYQYIYRRIGNVETARELTADVFQSLLQSVQQARAPHTSVRAWLYRTAHNLVIDEYRRQQHRQHLALSEVNLYADEECAEQVQQNIAAAQVRQALQTLTEEQQQVLTLKYLEGYSNHEVADIMGKTVGAVKALQHRGLATLQQQLTATNEAHGVQELTQ